MNLKCEHCGDNLWFVGIRDRVIYVCRCVRCDKRYAKTKEEWLELA